jgi:hypothetical protein
MVDSKMFAVAKQAAVLRLRADTPPELLEGFAALLKSARCFESYRLHESYGRTGVLTIGSRFRSKDRSRWPVSRHELRPVHELAWGRVSADTTNGCVVTGNHPQNLIAMARMLKRASRESKIRREFLTTRRGFAQHDGKHSSRSSEEDDNPAEAVASDGRVPRLVCSFSRESGPVCCTHWKPGLPTPTAALRV